MSVLVVGASLWAGGCATSGRPAHEPTPEPVLTGGPIGAQDAGYFRVRTFYATDRASQIDGNGDIRFTGSRGNGELAYGSVDVSIPDTHNEGEIERPGWWEPENPVDHVVVLSIDPLTGRAQFVTEIKSILAAAGRDDAFVFVHGFNVEFEEAARRTAQMAYDLNFPGAPIFYSWPSRGKVTAYSADEESVKWTEPHFRDFLNLVLTDLDAKTVHLIVHSMGNRAVVRALSRLDTSALPEGSAKLRQIILAAPDIDAGVYKQFAVDFAGKAERITLYMSKSDKAIQLSHKLHQEPRAGGDVVIVDGIDTVDASGAGADFLSHSYFGSAIIGDVKQIIGGDLSPDQRSNLRKSGDHWKYAAPD
jgi:esterase/lipase superfamily enzyme